MKEEKEKIEKRIEMTESTKTVIEDFDVSAKAKAYAKEHKVSFEEALIEVS